MNLPGFISEMDALNYGAYIASQYAGERSPDIDSPPYSSPPQVDLDEEKSKKKSRPPKLVVRFGSQGQQSPLDNNDTTPLSSPSPGPMSEGPVKRGRGRPRKLNPDGTYATNHVPVRNIL